MFRRNLLTIMTGAVWVAASSSLGATATFTPVGPTTVLAGTDVMFTVTVASPSGFDAADIVLGSNDATDLQFVYSAAWTTAFSTVTTLSFDTGFYAQDLFAGGNNATSVGTSMVLGTLTVKTAGMANGTYQVSIDHTLDSGISALWLASVKDLLSDSASFTIGCTVDPDCDDGLFCNGTETCVAGNCTPGTAPDCSGASDQCNVGVCNEATDTCDPDSASKEGLGCDDGQFCTTGETCMAGVCGGGSATDCSGQADQCNTGACNEALNLCEAQPVLDGTTCDDADPCTESDACTAGSCAGVNVPRITITVAVEGLAPAVSVARDVTSVLTVCTGPTTDTRLVQQTFDATGLGTVILESVDPSAAWINVREAHTLSRVRPLVFAACNQATVSLTVLDRLITGDVTGDGLVDIEDLSFLASGWNVAGSQADLNGDGQQNGADFTLMLGNILLTGDALDVCVP